MSPHIALPIVAALSLTNAVPASKADELKPIQSAQITRYNDIGAGASGAIIGLEIKPAPGWHIYWHNPGAMGEGTELQWQTDATATSISFPQPVPELFDFVGFKSYVYSKPTTFYARLRTTDRTPIDNHVLNVSAKVVACRNQCVPMVLEFKSRISKFQARTAFWDDFTLHQDLSKLPRPYGADGTFRRAGDGIELRVQLKNVMRGSKPVYFFPDTPGLVGMEQRVTPLANGANHSFLIQSHDTIPTARQIETGILELDDGRSLAIALRDVEKPLKPTSDTTSSDGRTLQALFEAQKIPVGNGRDLIPSILGAVLALSSLLLCRPRKQSINSAAIEN